jgi:hypothetical protein
MGSCTQLFTLIVKAATAPPPWTGGGPSGGGGGSSLVAYNIKVKAGENGSATADLIAAVAGTKVTITAKPAKGYVVGSVAVTDDKNESAIPVSKDSATKYSFIMPAADVTVTVTFVEEEPVEEPDAIDEEHDCPSEPYVDLDVTMWYHEYTDYVIANKLMTGTNTNPLMFEPNTRLSRAMMVQILYNMEGRPEVGGEEIFADVQVGSWYFDAIAWADANEIVYGYGEGKFGPEDAVTREQMVAILYRYSEYKGYDVTASAELDGFADASSVSGWAVPAMKWAVGSGLIIGRDGNQIAPLATATRAEVATIITRFHRTIVANGPAAAGEADDEEEADEDADIEDEADGEEADEADEADDEEADGE